MKRVTEPCWNCIYWTDDMKCPVRTFKNNEDLKASPMCGLGEVKDDGDFADMLTYEFPE